MPKTVLLRRSSLGDVVLLGAVTGALGDDVTVVTDARFVDVACRLNGVTKVVPWPDSPGGLPDGRLIDLQANARSRRLMKDNEGVTLNKRSIRRRARLISKRLEPRPTVPEIYAEACEVEVSRLPWISLERRAGDLLVLVPGAAWKTKRWSPEQFVALGRSWTGEVAVLGGPGEEQLCERIADGITGARSFAFVGFSEAFELYARAGVVVGGDTGLLHLAGACGVPVVMLFGPTDMADGFFVYPGKAISRNLFCRPCSLHGRERCPLVIQRCMNLPTEHVLQAALDLLCVG
jgi:ADP-heptose:LPS heptosyltransferase